MRDNMDYSGVMGEGDRMWASTMTSGYRSFIEGSKSKPQTRVRNTDQVQNLNVDGIDGATPKKF